MIHPFRVNPPHSEEPPPEGGGGEARGDLTDADIDSNWEEAIESFDAMGLPEELLRGIYGYGFEKPSAIQQRAIRPTMLGRDLIAQAQSGTVSFPPNYGGHSYWHCQRCYCAIKYRCWLGYVTRFDPRNDDPFVNHLSSLKRVILDMSEKLTTLDSDLWGG